LRLTCASSGSIPPRTVDSYRRDIDKFFRYINGEGVLFDKVDKDIVRNFLTVEITDDISHRSCQRRMSALRGFYDFMLNAGIRRVQPVPICLILPKPRSNIPKALYLEEITSSIHRE
jgi:integrase/recombinase XerC